MSLPPEKLKDSLMFDPSDETICALEAFATPESGHGISQVLVLKGSSWKDNLGYIRRGLVLLIVRGDVCMEGYLNEQSKPGS